MIRNIILVRTTAIVLTGSLLAMAAPAWAFAPKHMPEMPAPSVAKKAEVKKQVSKALSLPEMSKMKGRLGENPYVSGSQRYSVNMWGADLLTSNYITSATDLSFEGGYGDPTNVTRTYSANMEDEGPFGKGWTLSCDIRTTAGGLLKGPSSPDRSTPVELRQVPMGQETIDSDAYVLGERLASTDASGRTTEAKVDVDGVMSGPLWDKNVYTSVYEDVTYGGYIYTILTGMTVETPEGTIYVYDTEGFFADDETAVNFGTGGGTPDATPSKILKIQTITDRQGNVTTFNYTTSSPTYYKKRNGIAIENRLTSIDMPGGRSLTFTWKNDFGITFSHASITYNLARILSVTDGERTASYTYSAVGSEEVNVNLVTATSPAGFVTTYTYADAHAGSHWTGTGSGSLDLGDWVARNLLHTITDCRGLATTVDYAMAMGTIPGTLFQYPTACAFRITQPNGLKLYLYNGIGDDLNNSESWLVSDFPSGPWPTTSFSTMFKVGTSTSTINRFGALRLATDEEDKTMTVQMFDKFGGDYPNIDSYKLIWEKTYSQLTGDLTDQLSYIYPYNNFNHSGTHYLGDDQAHMHGFYDSALDGYSQSMHVVTVSNFLGNPLTKTVTESTDSSNPKTVEYAYHGYDKYFQQKAVKDPAGRFSFTEYYDRSATDGKKGQVYRVYDPKWSNGFSNSTGSTWKTDIVPSNTDLWSAQFDYDTEGRPTEVQKLQKGTVGTSSTYERVKTVTEYGGTGTPFWGAASKVTEDYGSGTHNSIAYINRVTETLTYNSAGKATKTKDAAGRYYFTNYDADGRVLDVKWDDNSSGTSKDELLDYTYGGSGISNGMPTEVRDQTAGLTSEVIQSISYTTSGGGIGQPSQISETREADTSANNSVDYTYTSAGERSKAIYTTPNGSRGWGYEGYRSVGSPESGGRAFTELWPLVYSGGNWNTHGDDPVFYHYDSAGRMMYAGFAQSPVTDWTGWPLDEGGHPVHPEFVANQRAVQFTETDAAGRAVSVANYWQSGQGYDSTTKGPAYSSFAPIGDGKVAYDYDHATGLRTDQKFYGVSSGAWSLSRTENYGYDSALDYLTSVDYNDGGSDEYRTWGYDAAGNRSSDSAYSTGTWAYDYLNRMTSSPKLFATGSLTSWTYTNDILGNRTTRNQYTGLGNPIQLMEWDKLGRMTRMASGTNSSSNGDTYTYRADGQRLSKVGGPYVYGLVLAPGGPAYYEIHTGTATPVTRYYYDGTMGMEDSTTSGSTTTINRYGLGARGIDRIEYYDGSSTTYGYPLYDGHGNMRATLYKDGTSYGTQNWKTYDVWGSVRTDGGGTPNPSQRYCADAGHVGDDETDLTYMRARSYEPSTGRFVSEDPAKNGKNWLVYCRNEPIQGSDATGCFVDLLVGMMLDNLLEEGDAGVSATAQQYGKKKILDAMAFWMGELTGQIFALDTGLATITTSANGYIKVFFEDSKEGFAFDFSKVGMAEHGGPHIDFFGDRLKHLFRSNAMGMERLDLFARGFVEGLIY